MAAAVGGMNGKLGWGQGEDEPASARVCRRQAEHVGEERADFLSLGGEHDGVHSCDHAAILATRGQSPAARTLSWSSDPVLSAF
jgi:hypothetical protein